VENPHGLIYGRLNGFRLSRLGLAQAEEVAAFFADRPIAAVYSSPRLRAVETAREILRQHPDLALRRSHLVDEVRSAFQGHLQKDVPPGVNMFDNPIAETDESVADVYMRMLRFIERVRERLQSGEIPPGEVVAVSHAAPIGVLRAGLEGYPLRDSSLKGERDPQKGSVTTLTYSACSALPTIAYRTVAPAK
jgi:broad specificity phosphatase PhoE